MTEEETKRLFETLERLDRNTRLAIRGLKLVLTELGIKKELHHIAEEIDTIDALDAQI